MTLDYFYGQAGELFSFYRIPKALFQEPRFQSLSTDAKTLYGILLDRMSLSAKNGWLDEQGRVFIIFTIEDVPCYILKITIYRSDDTMVDKFSQVAGNVPVTNNDPNRRYTVINGYPVVLNFAKEPNPGVFERVRDILLATSYTKKIS